MYGPDRQCSTLPTSASEGHLALSVDHDSTTEREDERPAPHPPPPEAVDSEEPDTTAADRPPPLADRLSLPLRTVGALAAGLLLATAFPPFD